MINDIAVIDAVTHAYNNLPDNRAAGHYSDSVAHHIYNAHATFQPTGYRVSRNDFERDWSAEETANIVFVEAGVDLAVHHVLPLETLWKDGHCSFEKTQAFQRVAPDRYLTYAGVDPLEGKVALDKLEAQVEALGDPIGVKLYPMRWDGDRSSQGWRMDDESVAFPLFEKAQALGLRVVAIHKAVPLGSVPRDIFNPSDVDRAAEYFPDLQFEIVHGGLAFTEETAWQMSSFDNVWINLEITSSLMPDRAKQFADVLSTILQYGGRQAIDRIVWGSGCVAFHPRPSLDYFLNDFSFDDQTLDYAAIGQLTADDKRKIVGLNYARLAGIDLPERLARIQGDTWSERRADYLAGAQQPWSTVQLADSLA